MTRTARSEETKPRMPKSDKNFMILKSVHFTFKAPRQITNRTWGGEWVLQEVTKQHSRRKTGVGKSQHGSNSVIPTMLMQGHESHSAGCRDVTFSNSPKTNTQLRQILAPMWQEQLFLELRCKYCGLGRSRHLAKSRNTVASGCGGVTQLLVLLLLACEVYQTVFFQSC